MALTKYHSGSDVTCKTHSCPTCGGVECFERPRYFSGQMLTDRDLESAQQYVIDKNRLHNRYLVGSGVVCGMAVRCDRCDVGTVVVRPGYAIDCCGNDIVLCEPASFDVAAYLKACRKKNDECDGKINSSPCDGIRREYYLVISYDEKQSRPMTALVRENGCSNTRCEPSRTQETFRFDLIAKEEWEGRKTPDMFDSMGKCLSDVANQLRSFMLSIGSVMGDNATHNDRLTLLCTIRDAVVNRYRKGVNIRCTIESELAAIVDSFPTSPNEPDYQKKVFAAYFRLLGNLIQYMLDCICDAFLVPCSPCDDEHVVLACLTVADDKVIKICNNARTQVLTGPAIRYWFGPLFTVVGTAIERICCDLDIASLFGLRAPQPRDPGATVSTADFDPTKWNRSVGRPAMMTTMGAKYMSSFGGFDASNMIEILTPDALTAMDIYDRSLGDAADILGEKNVTYNVKQATSDTEAYPLRNLLSMSWVIPEGSNVELVLNPQGMVASVKVRDGDQMNSARDYAKE